ncbi:MAG: hypothetical protein ACK5PF_08415, partial [bacterium]
MKLSTDRLRDHDARSHNAGGGTRQLHGPWEESFSRAISKAATGTHGTEGSDHRSALISREESGEDR